MSRGALLAALTALGVASAPAPSLARDDGEVAPASLEALMTGMASASGVVARFRELKRLALLTEPLESAGTLYFTPPDRLARVTDAPSRTRLVIDGDRFTFDDGTGEEVVDLSSNPIAREVVGNFIVLFNGDLEALRRRYEPVFESDEKGWTLALTPRRAPLRDVVARVTLEGRGRAIARMELLEASGDRTTTWFEDVRTDHSFDEDEAARIFRDGGAAPDTR